MEPNCKRRRMEHPFVQLSGRKASYYQRPIRPSGRHQAPNSEITQSNSQSNSASTPFWIVALIIVMCACVLPILFQWF